MARKAYLTGMLGIALVFIMVLAGCPNSSSEPSDTWTKVSDVNELAGTWKGKGAIPIPAQSIPMGEEEDALLLPVPASSLETEMTVSYAAGAENVHASTKANIESFLDAMAATVNTNAAMKASIAPMLALSVAMDEDLSDEEKSQALASFGITPLDVIALMSGDEAAIAAALESITITKDHVWDMVAKENPDMKKYYYIDNNAIPAGTLLNAGGDVEINQSGTKLQLKLSKDQFKAGNMGVEKDVEFILNRQSS
jgi:hypothetical protein